MKQVISVLTLFFLFLFACTTSHVGLKQNMFGDLPVLPENDRQIVAYTPIEGPSQPVSKDADFVIDDFDKGLARWTETASHLCKVELSESDQGFDGKSIKVSYSLVNKKQMGIDPDSVTIRITKHNRFEAFKGLEFMARASSPVKVRVLLYEYNQITSKVSAQEIWVKDIILTANWGHFKIPFTEFVSEEYYEQDFIGDETRNLCNIREVGFSINNHPDMGSQTGEFYIDNLFLF